MASGASTASSRVIAAMVVSASALTACAVEPARPDVRAAIGGRVIDAATGAAIEGAVVVAIWWTELPPNPAAIVIGLAVGGHGGSELRTAYVSEALTDREGRFTIPAWSATEQWRIGSLTSASPAIRFFAPGYSPTATTLGIWTSGSLYGGEIGLRGSQVMALYPPGKKPKRDPGFRTSGLAVPTVEEETLQELQKLNWALEAAALGADSPQARADSPARDKARRAQRHARQLVGQELRRVYGEYSARKAQSEKDKP